MPSDEISDEALRSKVINYEKQIVEREAVGDDADAGNERAKLKVFLRQQYELDSSRWAREPAWAAKADEACS